MTKHEILNCIEVNNEIIKLRKKNVKQLYDIRQTLTEIAPKVSVTEIEGEIISSRIALDEALKLNKKFKKQLMLLEQLETLENG